MLVALWRHVDARRERLAAFLGRQSGPAMVGALRSIMLGDLAALRDTLDQLEPVPAALAPRAAAPPLTGWRRRTG